jgi:hypothetical protein
LTTLSDQRFGVIQTTLNVNGKNLNFFCAHIYVNWNGGTDVNEFAVQQAQMNDLVTYSKTFPETRLISGDFNVWPDKVYPMTTGTGYIPLWQEAVTNNLAVAYPPDNQVGWGTNTTTDTRSRKGLVDHMFHTQGLMSLVLKSAVIPDTRVLGTTPLVLVGTPDDKGVRPSDHNPVKAMFLLK